MLEEKTLVDGSKILSTTTFYAKRKTSHIASIEAKAAEIISKLEASEITKDQAQIINEAMHTALTKHLFEPNDKLTRDSIVANIKAILGDLYSYRIICDETNNSPAVVVSGDIRVDIVGPSLIVGWGCSDGSH